MSGAFTHAVDGSTVSTVVDATDAAAWRYLDLDTGLSVAAGEGWDLAFSRFRIRINGGVSGTGGVQVVPLAGRTFDAVSVAPDAGWTSPVPDGIADDDTEPDNVFNNGTDDWYAYEPTSHTLTPKDITYVVATSSSAYFKLRIETYYDGVGTPAILRFRWAPVEAPTVPLPDGGMPPDGGPGDAGVDAGGDGGVVVPPDAITIDASSTTDWVYLSVEDGVVAPITPESDLGWDVAFRRTAIRTNGGTSGIGLGGGRLDGSGVAFADVTSATTFGYEADEVVTSGAPGSTPTSVNAALGGWYDYDFMTHVVSAGERSYLVRTSSGGYAKLRVWRWTAGVFQLSVAPVDRDVAPTELDIDASVPEAWTYLSLRSGGIVTVTDAATDATWDVGFSGTRVRTNGGTSGAGMGAAVETGATTLGELAVAPVDGYVADAILHDGSPGSTDFSGNATLGDWYDYDFMTHTVSPREVVYVVRTADGQLGALRVLAFADGGYRVAIAYAGAGQTTFR